MNIRAPLITSPPPPPLGQPGQGAFYDPTRAPQPTAMVSPTFGHYGGDPQRSPRLALRRSSIGPIPLNTVGAAFGPPALAPHPGAGGQPGQQVRHVMALRPRHPCCPRNPVCSSDHVLLTPAFSAIRRIRPRFFPLRRPPGDADSRPRRGSSQACPPQAVWRAGGDVPGARPLRGANRASAASRSSQRHSPSLAGALPTGAQTSAPRAYRSPLRGRVPVADRRWP
jgi:hypothetical protein